MHLYDLTQNLSNAVGSEARDLIVVVDAVLRELVMRR